MKVYRVLFRRPGKDWDRLNFKYYLKLTEAEEAVGHANAGSEFFGWNDEYKIQVAVVEERMFADAVRY